jgi:DNA invertase Pin-like site-specific DNA recombinase
MLHENKRFEYNMGTLMYLRTSTEEQNPENQKEDCINVIKDNGLGEYEIIEDKQSAWKDKERTGFKIVEDSIKSNNTKALVVWDLDRIYRNRLKLKAFFEVCKAYKCKVYSYRQEWLQTINKIPDPWNEILYDMLIGIYGHIAEDESNKKSGRVKASIRKKKGKSYSYKGNKWGRKSLSSQKTNKITELYEQGKSIRVISKELNLSIGSVHKYLTKFTQEKQLNIGVQ